MFELSKNFVCIDIETITLNSDTGTYINTEKRQS